MFAVVDARRPDLTTEAVLAGMADVFARPLGGRRVANAIAREQRYESRQFGGSPAPAALAALERCAHRRSLFTFGGDARRDDAGRAGIGASAAASRFVAKGNGPPGRRAIHARSTARWTADLASDLVGRATNCRRLRVDRLRRSTQVARPGAVRRRGRAVNGDARAASSASAVQGQLSTLPRSAARSYLQNVADASTRVQARSSRVGAPRSRSDRSPRPARRSRLEVRPMAGVESGIDGAVQEGRVREDLFRRLSVISIDMPPLRQRREDIPALANYFLRDVCAQRCACRPRRSVAAGAVADFGAAVARERASSCARSSRTWSPGRLADGASASTTCSPTSGSMAVTRWCSRTAYPAPGARALRARLHCGSGHRTASRTHQRRGPGTRHSEDQPLQEDTVPPRLRRPPPARVVTHNLSRRGNRAAD